MKNVPKVSGIFGELKLRKAFDDNFEEIKKNSEEFWRIFKKKLSKLLMGSIQREKGENFKEREDNLG